MSGKVVESDYGLLYKTLPPVLSRQDQRFYFARFYALRLSIWRQNIQSKIDRNSNLIFSRGSEKLKDFCTPAQFEELQTLERFLVERNLRFAAKLVFDPCFSGYRKNQDIRDLLQTAFLGLYPAIIKYDFKRGIPFSSFARFWIKKYIYRQGSTKIYKGSRLDVQLFNYDFNSITNYTLSFCKKTQRGFTCGAARFTLLLEPAFVDAYATIEKTTTDAIQQEYEINLIKETLFSFIRKARDRLNSTYEYFTKIKTEETEREYSIATKRYLRTVRWSVVLNALYDLHLPLRHVFGVGRAGLPESLMQLLKFFSATKQYIQIIKTEAINALKRVLLRNTQYT